jgi:sulfonate transport system substrate-binding protein
VGYLPNLTHAVALLGLDEGRFQRALGPGARVEGTQFVAGTEIVTAIAAGEIDLAYMGPGPAIKAFTQGVKIRLVAGAASGGSVLLARPGLAVRSPQDLAGKRVTVPRYANTQDVILRGFLARAGLRDTAHGGSVEVLQSDSPELPVLFGHGQIDAAIVPEPWGARLESGGPRFGVGVGGRRAAAIALTEAQMLGGETMPSAVLVASTRFVERRPDWARAWVATHRALVREINAAPAAMSERVNQALKRRTGKALKPVVLRKAWIRLTITDQVTDRQLVEFAAMMRSAGYLRVPFDPATFRWRAGSERKRESTKVSESTKISLSAGNRESAKVGESAKSGRSAKTRPAGGVALPIHFALSRSFALSQFPLGVLSGG